MVFSIFTAWLACGPAHADKRVALVIGNSAYEHVPRLANPVHDAALVARMLTDAGFDTVTSKFDLDASAMRKELRDFGLSAAGSDIAVIYYAGHGMELDGNNYLIPVDASLQTDADVLDETVSLDRVLFSVESAKQLRLVILDACRDNPFAKTMKRTIATRGIGRGLAKVELNAPNTMIAFAAKAGSTAADGVDGNGPFAEALVKHLPQPGLDLRLAFGYVRDDVLKSTGYQQEPFVYGSLGGDKVPLVPAKPVDTGPKPNPQDAIRRDFEFALHLGTRDGWNAFLAQYPEGFYASLARGELNKIVDERARSAAAETARLAEQEKARLAAEGTRKAEQDKAEAEAKAAEQARIAAEKAKQIAQAKAEAAEQARIAAEKALADRIAAEKAAAETAAAGRATKQATENRSGEAGGQQSEQPQRVASLPPSADAAAAPSGIDLIKSVQSELHRVGCLAATGTDAWNVASRRALTMFNKYAGTSFDVKVASADALEAIKAKPSRVCPLVCDHDFRADGGRCVRIACPAGSSLGNDQKCEKVQARKPAGTSEPRADHHAAQDKVQDKAEAESQSSATSTRIFCDRQGCREVQKGCHVEMPPYAPNIAERGGKLVCR